MLDYFNIPNVKPISLCGHGNTGDTSRMTSAQQTQVINSFKNNNNILITTQVAEEGLDIPVCKYVIRMDKIDTLKSFVQSRGRARDLKSNFFYFVDRGNDSKLSLFQYI